MSTTIYVSIGNSDDKLTQAEWAEYYARVRIAVRYAAHIMHGEWLSASDSPWQNAAWSLEPFPDPTLTAHLRRELGRLAGLYRQDSIAWLAGETEFLTPEASS